MNRHLAQDYQAKAEALLDGLGDDDREAVTRGEQLLCVVLGIESLNAEQHYKVTNTLAKVLFNDF